MIEHPTRPIEGRNTLRTGIQVLFFLSTICFGAAYARAGSRPVQQAVIITIPLATKSGSPDELQHLYKLEDEVIKAIERSHAGEYDGNEIGEGTFTMYAYGPSADKLFDSLQPVLAKFRMPPASRAVERYGNPGAKEERIPLDNGTVSE